jgi:hypothetical protein
MIETHRAGAGDAAELMRLRTAMLGALHAGEAAAGEWLSTGVAVLQRLLIRAR